MESRIVNSASGNTIKESSNPINWLFRNWRSVSHFEAKILQDGGGLLIAQLDNGNQFRMTWADHTVMIDRLFHSRAWSNHFYQIKVYVINSAGTERMTRIIK